MKFSNKIEKFAKNTRLDIQTALENAREKLKGNSQMLGMAGILVLGSFVFLAILAPFAFRSKGLISAILSYLPIIVLFLGIYFAINGLLKLSKSEKKEAITEYKGTLAKTAIDIAVKEVIDAGLMRENEMNFSDSQSGINNSFAVVSFRANNIGCYVIRLKKEFDGILLLNPKNTLWPVKLPTNKKLTPLIPPQNIPIEAWGFIDEKSREKSQMMLNLIAPVLNMSLLGGELPFIFAHDKSFIIGFKAGDIGTIGLIGNEATKVLKTDFGGI